MERRILCAWGAFALALALPALGNLSVARADVVPAVEPSSSSIEQAIRDGLELERNQDWAEALTHYEDAMRLFSKAELKSAEGAKLRRRMGVARLHFDLGRRYNDSSFYTELRGLSHATAIELYDEVLLSVETNYVDNPNWNSLLRNGTTGLSIALRDREFQKVNNVKPSYEVARKVIDRIWKTQIARDFRSRQQASDFVRWASRLVSQQTGVNPTTTVLEYACGATSALDIYSTFLTGNELDEVYSQIEGNFVGLGVELKPDDDTLLIDSVISKGPADRAGIRSGDRHSHVLLNNAYDVSYG